MVYVFCLDKRFEYGLDVVQTMNARELVKLVSPPEFLKQAELTYKGTCVCPIMKLKDLPFKDSSCFRVIIKDKSSEPSTEIPPSERQEVNRLLQFLISGFPRITVEAAFQKVIMEDNFFFEVAKDHPFIKRRPDLAALFADPEFFRLVLHKSLGSFEENYATFSLLRSLIIKVTTELENDSTANPLPGGPIDLRAMNASADQQEEGNARPRRGPDVITREMLSQAINFAMDSINGDDYYQGPEAATAAAAAFNLPPPVPTRQPLPRSGLPQSQPIIPSVPPYELYAAQLARMAEFGFNDVEENIQALLVSEGNLDLALEVLITMREEE